MTDSITETNVAIQQSPDQDTETMTTTTRDENKEKVSTNQLPPLPLCRVDRYWLQKLILKHQGVTSPSQDQIDKTRIYASAPMVDQSDLPFRLLCRQYGTNLCFTPMIHAKMFTTQKQYRTKFTLQNTPLIDRPLIAQLCGGADPETMLQCALQVQDYCDGIDINCGCPQNIAKRGNYGAFLLEKEEMLITLVRHLAPRLKVPLSVKVRLLPDETDRVAASLKLYEQLADAGIHLLTIHGRTRYQKAHETGPADWAAVGKAVQLLGDRIPILANGSLGSPEQVQSCLEETRADGVMSSEAILEYPPLFAPLTMPQKMGTSRIGRIQLAREYLEWAVQYPPEQGGQGNGFKCIRVHMHRFLHADLQRHTDIRDAIVRARNLPDLEAALGMLEAIHTEMDHDPQSEELTWYVRHRKNDQDHQDNEKPLETCDCATATLKKDENQAPNEDKEKKAPDL